MSLVFKYCIILFVSLLLWSGCKKSDSGNKVNINCLPANLQSGVLAFYPFSGGSLNDFSGNNHNLVNNTTAVPGMDRGGNPGCAYLFTHNNNLDEFLVHSNPAFLDGLNDFSVSVWYMPLDTTRNGAILEALVCRDSGRHCPDKMGQWSISLYDCRRAVFGRTNSTWDVNNFATGTTCEEVVTANTNHWQHVVITFRQSGAQMALYKDGVLQSSTSGDINCGSGVVQAQDIGDLFLGKDYNGLLDDVIIYNRILTPTEINQLYQVAPCCGT